jgi:hypothetical protein
MTDPTTLWHELRGPREWGVDPTWVAVTGTTSDGPLPDDDVSPDDWLDVPALLVHHDGCTKTWLVLDARRRLPFNVFRLQHEDYDGGRAEVMPTWIGLLHAELSGVERQKKRPKVIEYRGSEGEVPNTHSLELWTDAHTTGRKVSTDSIMAA